MLLELQGQGRPPPQRGWTTRTGPTAFTFTELVSLRPLAEFESGGGLEICGGHARLRIFTCLGQSSCLSGSNAMILSPSQIYTFFFSSF